MDAGSVSMISNPRDVAARRRRWEHSNDAEQGEAVIPISKADSSWLTR